MCKYDKNEYTYLKYYICFKISRLCPPSSFFTTLRKLLTDFIWNNKRARVRLSLLYMPYNRGWSPVSPIYSGTTGQHSYDLLYIIFLLKTHTSWFGYWIFLYKVKLPLNLYLYSADIKSLRKDKDIVSFNPILINTINVWCDVYKYLGSVRYFIMFYSDMGEQAFQTS